MSPLSYKQQNTIDREEAREELLGKAGKGTEAYTIIATVLATILTTIAFETIDSWAQWVVLAGIITTLVGLIIALSPRRPR